MELLTRAIWDFMEGSYRKGVLDELLGLVGALSDPEVDMGKQLGDFEDRLSDADFGVFEEMSTEILTPALQALADEKVLESLHVLLITTRPLIDAFMERVGGDTNVASEMLGLIKQNVQVSSPVATPGPGPDPGPRAGKPGLPFPRGSIYPDPSGGCC